MDFSELKDKANSLPLSPGVYIMKDRSGAVIYVGKAKKLRNRVSQYFLDTVSHSPKTRMMVSKIHQFDVIVAASEFEALVLECSLIKRHMPKYNILLKDDKGYPYLRLNMKDEYPSVTLVNKPADDGAGYYGPFGSRGVTNNLLKTIRTLFKLPDCTKRFPKDIGKDRPCLNYHMNQCEGWCQPNASKEEYRQRMELIRQLLQGNYKHVTDHIRKNMLEAAEDLNFELAASYRDNLSAVEALGKKQLVTAGTLADTDVIGFAQTPSHSCFTILHFSGGNLLDKDVELLPAVDDAETAVSSLLKQYYLGCGFAPRNILVPFALDDSELIEQLFSVNFGRKTTLNVPIRGDKLRLVELANTNAREEAERITTKEERLSDNLNQLKQMLRLESVHRIESYDISNISGTDIVGAMVVFINGKPRKSEYKRFKLKEMSDQDDYAAMQQVLERRFIHLLEKDSGFSDAPDLLLIDGGVEHSQVAQRVLERYVLCIPVFGMVKDDRHRTKALVTPDGQQIAIDCNQSVFAMIGNIQEETHRFAITYHRSLRSKRLRYSELDKIPGIGPSRKQLLLKRFKSISAIASATVSELERILPADAAMAVYTHFQHGKEA